jgi:[NiFe] hydrogenase diaphorase moiety large subunit
MSSTKLSHLEVVRPIVEKYAKDPNALLQILIEVQEILHCVPKDVQDYISKELFGKSRVRVPAVISFYSFLSEQYLGEYVVHFADNIIEQMLGNRELAARLCSKLGVKIGKVRNDGRVSVHFTSCIGMSDQAPAILVNGRTIPKLTPEKVDVIAQSITAQMPVERWPESLFVVEDNIRRSDVLFRRKIEPGSAIKACLDRAKAAHAPVALDEQLSPLPSDSDKTGLDHAAQETLAEMYRSDLRGRGGAGFKAAIKWETARDKKGSSRYVLCNADEGEPGTFKDRVLLQNYADMVFEGMTVCGFTIKAKLGILYIRGEYRYMKEHLDAVLQKRREQNLLGEHILGSPFSFDIKIHWGAGAYVCGMETAMIESIEGKRGSPRKRWPLPVEWGYKGQPTVVNNVETYAGAAIVAVRGGSWFAQHGTMQSTGTKLFCVSGDCERPGIYEYPFGVSIREVLRDCGARNTQAVQISGPSGMMLPESEFDRLLAFEDVPSVGTVMIFDKSRDMFDVLHNFAKFFQHESCGLCTPCRVGTTLLVNILDKFKKGQGSALDLEEIKNISQLLKTFSHCGLGQTAQAPFMDALQKFRPIFDKRLKSKEFIPAFSLNAALEEARQLTGRTDPGAFIHEDIAEPAH